MELQAGSLAGQRVAVIGGTGFIGSHLIERLVGDGADVLSVAQSPKRLSNLAAVRNHTLIGLCDITESQAIDQIFQAFKPAVVYHLAAQPDSKETFTQMADCIRTNGLGLVRALEAADKCGAEVFVYGDSAKVYGNQGTPYRVGQLDRPECSYAIVKSAGWQLCTLAASFSRLNVVSLRPTFVYGPRQAWNVISYVYDCVASGRPIRLQGGSQTRDPLYIDDAVEAFVRAAVTRRAWGHAIPVGGGEEVTVAALCRAVISSMGENAAIEQDAAMPRTTEIWRSCSDNSDASSLLDWTPRVSMAEGLRLLWQYSPGGADRIRAFSSSARVHAAPGVPVFRYRAFPKLEFTVIDRRCGARRDSPRGGRRTDDLEMAAQQHQSVVAASEPRLEVDRVRP